VVKGHYLNRMIKDHGFADATSSKDNVDYASKTEGVPCLVRQRGGALS
jgi:hypothetical protein